MSSAIEEAVLSRQRSAADRERDAASTPAAVLTFLEVSSGMTVLDLHAATGYYAELLSYVVGEHGRVIAHNHPDTALHGRTDRMLLRFRR